MEINAVMNYNNSGELISVTLDRDSFVALVATGTVLVNVNSFQPSVEKKGIPDDLETTITKRLTALGIPRNVKGFKYLREAITICTEDPQMIDRMTKELYPDIAKRFDATPTGVGRAIGHAIETSWKDNENVRLFNSCYGTNFKTIIDKPTCSEYIATVSDSLRLEMAG